MRNKRGFQLAISTVIILVIAVILLAGLISFLVTNWEKFSDTVKGYSSSDEQIVRDLCENQCTLVRDYDFCCIQKSIGGEEISCLDLNMSCSNIDCEGIC